MKSILSLFAGLVLSTCLVANAEPLATDQVLAPVKAKAAAEQKAVFLHFGASWCGWCKRLDAFLEKPNIKPTFEKYFVCVKLVVKESDKNKNLENPGAEALLKQLGGDGSLPFSAFLDAQGKLIVNSNLDKQNVGYPGAPKEIDWFIKMIKTAAPKITAEDLKVIETELRSFKR